MSAAELKQRRERLGLSLSEMGEALGVDRQTVWRWEKGVYAIPAFLTLALETIEQQKGKQP